MGRKGACPPDRPDNGPRPTANYKGNGLQIELTVADDGAFTMPWSATLTFWHSLEEWRERVCAENIPMGTQEMQSEVPIANRPDFRAGFMESGRKTN